MTPLIREAVPDDVPVLFEIEREAFGSEHWDRDSFLTYDCLVAEVERQIAGFLVSREVFPGIQGTPPEREILNIAVARTYRRMGVATALLRRQLSLAATHYLEVRESNLSARQLYEGFGFKEVGRRPDYYLSPVESAIVMRLN